MNDKILLVMGFIGLMINTLYLANYNNKMFNNTFLPIGMQWIVSGFIFAIYLIWEFFQKYEVRKR